MLTKINRLQDKGEFQDVYLRGNFFSQGPLVVKYAKNNRDVSRFGFAVGKNYSKSAVDRNTAKRVLRAAVRPLVAEVAPGVDFVISLRKPLDGGKVKVAAATESLRTLFKKNNLLK